MGLKCNGIIIFQCKSEVKSDFIDSGDSDVYRIEYFLDFIVCRRYSVVFDDFLNFEGDNCWVFLLYDWKICLVGLFFEVQGSEHVTVIKILPIFDEKIHGQLVLGDEVELNFRFSWSLKIVKAFFGRSGSIRVGQFLPDSFVNGWSLKDTQEYRQWWHLISFKVIEGLEICIGLVFVGHFGGHDEENVDNDDEDNLFGAIGRVSIVLLRGGVIIDIHDWLLFIVYF